MRIIVISDTHGREYKLRDILADQPEAEVLICLGDGVKGVESLMEEYPHIKFYAVCGNCDVAPLKEYDILKIAGKQLLIAHGHTYGVKFGLEKFLNTACVLGVDMALYGHTHEARVEYRDGIYLVNPGASNGAYNGSCYAVIDISKAGIMPSLMTADEN